MFKIKSKFQKLLAAVAIATSVPVAGATPIATQTVPSPAGSELTMTRTVGTVEKTRIAPRKTRGGHLGYFPYGLGLDKPYFLPLKYGHVKRHFNKKRHGVSLRRKHRKANS